MVNLDATAGNRVMWKCKNPPDYIFIDKEYGLHVAPDVFCDNTQLPFRDNVFNVVIYGPPHMNKPHSLMGMDPRGKFGDKRNWTWYGYFNTKRQAITSMFKAQCEFQRVSSRLCLKWNEFKIPLHKIHSLFSRSGWMEIYRKNHKSRKKSSKHITWWVTFVKDV
jgi:hypothetical protein